MVGGKFLEVKFRIRFCIGLLCNEKKQISPLLYASVEMTDLFVSRNDRFIAGCSGDAIVGSVIFFCLACCSIRE